MAAPEPADATPAEAPPHPNLGRREQFERDGFLHIKAFASQGECAGMQKRMRELVAGWDPRETLAPVFRTDTSLQGNSDYFLDSADRIHFFLEKGAAQEDGGLKPQLEKSRALNKVGHGLHVEDDVFREYSSSGKVADLVRELGWQSPVLPQSMYIFKQPAIGGEVVSHQDSTFLYTTPRQTCLGLWLALDKSTLQNGCLWARPGSHRELVRRQFVRNPKYFVDKDAAAPQMIFENVDHGSDAWDWEGKLPRSWESPHDGLREKGFQLVECEVGDLVVIHGQVDHLSLPNTSDRPRETFQLHLIDGPEAGIAWSEKNWLQYPPGKPFPRLDLHAGVKRKAGEL